MVVLLDGLAALAPSRKDEPSQLKHMGFGVVDLMTAFFGGVVRFGELRYRVTFTYFCEE